ncbi:MAG: insulinase family protein [Chloroflexi bacterium]|nr:insulinase family protein [Chloroflexota bacterium]
MVSPYQQTVLSNGLRVLSCEMPHTRSVSIDIFAGIGSRYEEDKEAGVSHFLEHMLFKGTTRRPSGADISGAIEQIGGMMNAGTDRETTSFWCKVASPHFGRALDVLMDIIRNPLMSQEDVDKERGVIQEELNMTNDYPSYRVDLLTDEMLWPDQPMGRDVGGTRETVDGITRQMILDWFQRHYVASNMVVSVAGNVSHGEVVETVATLAGDMPSGSLPVYRIAAHDNGQHPRVRLESRKTEQAHLSLCLPGLATRHPDRYALDLMNGVLGDGMSSRLFVEMRETRGLAYEVHSSLTHFRDTGSIVVYCGVEPKKAKEAVETVLGELQRIKDGVPDEELSKAKEFAKGRLLLRMEDTRAVAGWAGAQEILYGEVLSVDEVVERVEAISTEDVLRAARDYLVSEQLRLAVVGPYRSDRQFQALLR